MKTILKRTAIALFVGLLPAAAATAQVNVNTPPAGGANVQAGPANVQAGLGGTNIQAGPATIQAGPGGANVAVPPGTGAAIRDNAAARQDNRIDRRENRQGDRAVANDNWRMLRHQNRWWYYHPNNSWSYYHGNQWVPYRQGANQPLTATQAGPNQPRRYSSGYRGPMENRTGAGADARANPNDNGAGLNNNAPNAADRANTPRAADLDKDAPAPNSK